MQFVTAYCTSVRWEESSRRVTIKVQLWHKAGTPVYGQSFMHPVVDWMTAMMGMSSSTEVRSKAFVVDFYFVL